MFLWSEPTTKKPEGSTAVVNTSRQVSEREDVCLPWPHTFSRSQWKEKMDLDYRKSNVYIVRDNGISSCIDALLLAPNPVTNHNKADPTTNAQISE